MKKLEVSILWAIISLYIFSKIRRNAEISYGIHLSCDKTSEKKSSGKARPWPLLICLLHKYKSGCKSRVTKLISCWKPNADKSETLDALESNITRVIDGIRSKLLDNWTFRMGSLGATRVGQILKINSKWKICFNYLSRMKFFWLQSI